VQGYSFYDTGSFEYIQLHRDTTVYQLIFTTSLDGGGIIHDTDSPLLRAIRYGRYIIIDKAPENVVAISCSLAGSRRSDALRVRPVWGRKEES